MVIPSKPRDAARPHGAPDDPRGGGRHAHRARAAVPYDRRAVNGHDLGALSTEEGYAAVTEYAIRHPLVARVLERAFGFEITRSEEARRAFSVSVALVAFRPMGG